jgi:hypothetical protein
MGARVIQNFRSLALVLLLLVPASADAAGILPGNSTLYADGWEGNVTDQMIVLQEQNHASGTMNTSDLQAEQTQGNDRAKAVGNMLRNMEMEKLRVQMAPVGDRLLAEMPGARIPVAVIGVGAKVWMGQSISVVHQDSLRVDTFMGMQNRRASIDLHSKIADGRAYFEPNSGMNLGVGRNLEFIGSRAEFQYSFKDQSMTTAVSKVIVKHLALSVMEIQPQATQSEAVAQVAYQLVF